VKRPRIDWLAIEAAIIGALLLWALIGGWLGAWLR